MNISNRLVELARKLAHRVAGVNKIAFCFVSDLIILVKMKYIMRDFENLKSGGNGVLNTCNKMTILLVMIVMSRWFLNILPNLARAAELVAYVWFARRFMNH